MTARFARNGYTSPLGKVQPPLGQLRLRQLADEKLRALALVERRPALEIARDLLEVLLVGREEINHRQSIYLDRIESLLPKGNGKVRT